MGISSAPRAFWLALPLLLADTKAQSGTCECPASGFLATEPFTISSSSTPAADKLILAICELPTVDTCVKPNICQCDTSGPSATLVDGGYNIKCFDAVGTCLLPGPHDDPHMTGLLGQTFDWAGTDGGWYAMVSDGPDLQLNVRVTAPLSEFPDRQLITGVALILNGGQNSLVIGVADFHPVDTDTHCSVTDSHGSSLPCLAGGALFVMVDGKPYAGLETAAAGVVLPDGDTFVSATNLPAECQPFGGDRVWAETFETMQRSLRGEATNIPLEEWVLRSGTLAAPEWCAKFQEEEGIDGLFNTESLHTVFHIDSPLISLRINIGTNHQDSQMLSDGRDVPELEFWQANVGVEWGAFSSEVGGMLGETSRVVLDDNDEPAMHGLGVLGGPIESYRVSGPLGVDFDQLHSTS